MSHSLHLQTITPELRAEWLEARKTRLGASEIATAAGINPYESALRLWLTKSGKLPAKTVTEPMRIGSALESGILDLYEQKTENEILFRQVFTISPEHDWLCATLDGITSENINVQTKNVGCDSVINWGPDGSDGVPHHVLVQVQQEMHCSGLELSHVVALLGGSEVRVYPIERSDLVIGRLVALGQQFLERVRTGQYPEPDDKDDDLLKYLWPGCAGEITFDEEQTQLVQRWERAKREFKQLESQEEKLKRELLMVLGEANHAKMTDGRTLVRGLVNVKARVQEVKAYFYHTLRTQQAK